MHTYLPAIQLRAVAEALGRGAQSMSRRAASVGLLFVDVAGFTRMTERFTGLGNQGAERLSEIINASFGRMTELVLARGGDVLVYAGDALWAVWPAAGPTKTEEERAVTLAASCALTIQETFASRREPAEIEIQVRATVAAGHLEFAEVGAEGGPWQFLAVGEAILDATRADEHASVGAVVVSEAARRRAAAKMEVVPVGSGVSRLIRVVDKVPTGVFEDRREPHAALLDDESLRRRVPRVVAERIAAGQGQWLTEFRRLSIVFMKLDGLAPETADWQARLQCSFDAIQPVIARFEGTIYQFLADDKGVTLVAAFGLAPLAHEDDAARAVRAALAVRDALVENHLRPSIGIATGWAFCANYGLPNRRQFTLVGSVVNLAARLMQAAGGHVRCDRATAQSASTLGLRFQPLPPVLVKGRDEPVAWFEPLGAEPVAALDPLPEQQPLVGRVDERSVLSAALERLREGRGGTFVIEAEAGLGKSRLVSHLCRQAQEAGFCVALGAAHAWESCSQYHAYIPVLRRLFGLDEVEPEHDDAEARRHLVLSRLALHPALLRLAPLLSPLLDLGLPNSAATAAIVGEARGQSTKDLLLACLEAHANAGIVVVLEDAHWFDSASWELTAALAELPLRVLLVVTTRPLSPEPEPLRRMADAKGVERLRLAALGERDLLELVVQRFGTPGLAPPVTDFLHARASGNPFHAIELTHALRDLGLVRAEADGWVLAPGVEHLADAFDQVLAQRGLPATLEGVVMSRVDQLGADEQLVLKVASVVGPRFSLSTLRDLEPVHEQRLGTAVKSLCDADLVTFEPAPAGFLAFRHVISQEAIYASIPFVRRRELHGRVAASLEHANHPMPASLEPLFAHHLQHAGETRRAALAFSRAGGFALRQSANEEAVRFLRTALDLDAELAGTGAAVNDVTRAEWEVNLGRAYVAWSRFAESRDHLERGLTLFRQPVPRCSLGALARLLLEALRQACHRRARDGHLGRLAGSREVLLEASRAYEGLVETYFFVDAQAHCAFSALRSLNLAELAGPSPELARGYAAIGAILGFMRLHRLARGYCTRALEMVRRVGDVPARIWVNTSIGVYRAGIGDFGEALEAFRDAAELAERIGDRRRWEDCIQSMAAVRYMMGDVAESLHLAESFRGSAVRRSDHSSQAEAARRRAYCLIALGRWDEAGPVVDELNAARERSAQKPGAPQLFDRHAVTALYQLHRGALAEARCAADEAVRLVEKTPTFYDQAIDCAAVAQVFASLRAVRFGGPEEARALRRSSHKIRKRLRVLSGSFPVAAPAQLRVDALESWNDGRCDLALKGLRESAARAARLKMALDESLARAAVAGRFDGAVSCSASARGRLPSTLAEGHVHG